jgi:RNA polymerase sigma factor (TIGR02999 family)
MEPRASVTQLLRAWRAGEPAALDELMPLVYDELRRLARRHLRAEAPGNTLSPTALVHEAFLRLVDADVPWQDRVHFLAVGARIMRRVLVDRGRARRAQKRGAGVAPVEETVADPASGEPAVELLALDLALDELARIDERKAQAVELIYFGGLSYDEVAEALGISRATAHRDLRLAKAWLYDRIAGGAA